MEFDRFDRDPYDYVNYVFNCFPPGSVDPHGTDYLADDTPLPRANHEQPQHEAVFSAEAPGTQHQLDQTLSLAMDGDRTATDAILADPMPFIARYCSNLLAEVLGSMPERKRKVLILRVALGCSREQTAEVLEISTNAVLVLQHGALNMLRHAVSRQTTTPAPEDFGHYAHPHLRLISNEEE